MDTHKDGSTDLKMKEGKTVANQHHITTQNCPRWDSLILCREEIIFDKMKFEFKCFFGLVGPTLKGVVDSGKS